MKPDRIQWVALASMVLGLFLVVGFLRGLARGHDRDSLGIAGALLLIVGFAVYRWRIAVRTARDPAAAVSTTATEAPGPRPWHAGVAVIEPVVPVSDPGTAGSWIGGDPSPPDGVDWPMLDVVAAVFEA